MTTQIRFTFAFALAALVALLPDMAMADGLDNSIGCALQDVVDLATGTAGKAIATAAIVFLGIGAFFGKVNWGLAMMVALGVVLIFGAATIAQTLRDENANSQSDANCND